MISSIFAAAGLLTTTLAQLPPSYKLASTDTTLGVTYGSVDVTPGQVLGFNTPSQPPILTSPIPLNASYIAILVDTTANLSALIPASLLWFQQDLTFPSKTAAFNASAAQVPYLAPSNPGHAYLALLYQQPPGFKIPADFPYTDTFRKGFNVSRVAVDFRSPLAEANWFVLGSNCTEAVSALSGTAVASGTAAVTATRTGYGFGYPTAPAGGYHGRRMVPRGGYRWL